MSVSQRRSHRTSNTGVLIGSEPSSSANGFGIIESNRGDHIDGVNGELPATLGLSVPRFSGEESERNIPNRQADVNLGVTGENIDLAVLVEFSSRDVLEHGVDKESGSNI